MSWLIPDVTFLDNKLYDLLLFAVILFIGLLFKRFGAKFLSKQSFRIFKSFSHNQFSEIFIDLLRKPIEQLITVLVIYFAFERLNFWMA